MSALRAAFSALTSFFSMAGVLWQLAISLGLNVLMRLMRGGPISVLAATALIVFVPPSPVALLAMVDANVGIVAYAVALPAWLIWLAWQSTKTA